MIAEQLENVGLNHVKVGQNVMILTRGYHWVGEIAFVSALKIILVKATMFVNIGQIDSAMAGKFDDRAHGRQIPPNQPVEIFRPSADIIDWPHTLPTKAIGD